MCLKAKIFSNVEVQMEVERIIVDAFVKRLQQHTDSTLDSDASSRSSLSTNATKKEIKAKYVHHTIYSNSKF